MSVISVEHLTFCHTGSFEPVFKDISFRLDSSWKTGLIGRNGRGKTTLLGLLGGNRKGEGTIFHKTVFEEFPFSVNPDCLAFDALQERFPQLQVWQVEKEPAQMQCSSDCLWQIYSTLSGGEQTKLHLAALFCLEHTTLLIDEPTNHLDEYGRKQLAEYLKQKKQGFLPVSHDRAFLDACTDHTLCITKTGIELVAGNYSVWKEQNERNEHFQQQQNKKLKNEITRLEQAARQASGFSQKAEKEKYSKSADRTGSVDRGFLGAKAARLMKQAKQIEARKNSAAEEKSKLLLDIETAPPLKLSPLSFHNAPLIEAKNLCFSYGQHSVFSNLSFSLHSGQRLALQGKNGCGKSTLIQLILGQKTNFGGTLRLANGLRVAYLPQTIQFLQGDLYEFAQQNGFDIPLFFAILRKLGFSRTQFQIRLENYSNGQKKKVLIAQNLCQPAHLYLWDEPLNFLDLDARLQIETLLLTFCPTLVFVEHDSVFTDKIATHRLLL